VGHGMGGEQGNKESKMQQNVFHKQKYTTTIVSLLKISPLPPIQ